MCRSGGQLDSRIPVVEPARGALIALLKMGPPERTQGWFPKQFDHGMYLLGESLDKVRTFQRHVVRLAMENGHVDGPLPNDTPRWDDRHLLAQGCGG